MKILVIGTIDNRGGAANVSWELRKRLKQDGHTVTTFVRYKYSDEPDVFVIPRKRWQDWLVKLFANDLHFARTDYLLETKEFKEADMVHCHNLHSNFFNLKTLQKMSLKKPVVWTLHDMWAFTGFASNSFILRHPHKKKFLLYLWDNTHNLLREKKKIYEKSKLFMVTVSEWLKKETEKSILGKQNITCIYNGIDTETFKPGDKTLARKKLGLPLDKKIIAFGIKGWQDVNKIMDEYIDRTDIFFVAVGHNTLTTKNKNCLSLPQTQERDVLAEYLSSADVFVHLTPEDSFGLIHTEALSCGIPVVTYNVDALPETVVHKETGYIAEYENIDDAKAGIEYLLNLSTDEYKKMREKARERIVKNFSQEKMYTEYLALYKKIIEKAP
jgi:glycosyltransferase involved in cell wall biosynthesis